MERVQRYNKYLKKYFGYDKLKEQQLKIIDKAVYKKRDICAILATGFGKSICYQIPYLVTKKTVIIVCPLISLMEDQKTQLEEKGIPVCNLNGNNKNKHEEKKKLLDGEHKIVYITPEYLCRCEDFIKKMVKKDYLSMFAIDESHCVSQWGLNFRKDYCKLNCLKDWAPEVPILALTATATEKVRNDICNILKLENPYHITGGFDRPNLYIHVKEKTNIADDLLELLRKYKSDPKIIYCKTRDATKELSREINKMKIKCKPYHAGLDPEKRNKTQEEFTVGKISCIVATVAFGMGINIPNIRLVVHYGCPSDLESYYQEIGRAGRDNKESECYLFHCPKDFNISRYFLRSIDDLEFRKYRNEQINKMDTFVHMKDCRRKLILESFGEKLVEDKCFNCDNCTTEIRYSHNWNFMETDLTKHYKILFDLLVKYDKCFSVTTIIDILKGKSNIDKRLKKLTSYGTGKEFTGKWWKEFTRLLLTEKYIIYETSEQATNVVAHTEKGLKCYKNEDKLILRGSKYLYDHSSKDNKK